MFVIILSYPARRSSRLSRLRFATSGQWLSLSVRQGSGESIENSQVDHGTAIGRGVRLSCVLRGGFINNVSITLYLGAPPEGWLKVTLDVMTHIYLGAAFTYSAVRIAPSAPKYVALVTSVLLLVFVGLSLWSSFVIGKFYALPALGGVLFGGAAAVLATFAVRSCRTMPTD